MKTGKLESTKCVMRSERRMEQDPGEGVREGREVVRHMDQGIMGRAYIIL